MTRWLAGIRAREVCGRRSKFLNDFNAAGVLREVRGASRKAQTIQTLRLRAGGPSLYRERAAFKAAPHLRDPSGG